MKKIMILPALAGINIFTLIPGALAAEPAPDVQLQDIKTYITQKQFASAEAEAKKVLALGKKILGYDMRLAAARAYSTARFAQTGGSFAEFCTITEEDYNIYRPQGSLFAYQYGVIQEMKKKDFLRPFYEANKQFAATNSSAFNTCISILQTLGDLKTAYQLAVSCEQWLKAAQLLTANQGGAFTENDAQALFDAINKTLDSHVIVLTPAAARDWSTKILPGLFTTGKITKAQYVDTLKKMYTRCYLRLGEDNKIWEPIIAQIKFGINYADKIAEIMKL